MKKPQRPPVFSTSWPPYHESYNDLTSRVNQQNEEAQEIRRLIRKCNEQAYIHWDDLRRKKLPYDPITFWYVIRTIRGAKYRELRIGSEIFLFSTPEKFQKPLHLIDKASPASFDWLFGEFPSEKNKKQCLINSLMEEAIASSQLEGAATPRPEAKKILREGRKPKDTSERMIVNTYRTILRLKELRDQPLSRELIREIHHGITKGTLESEDDGTDFRTCNDIVVGTADPTEIYDFPPDCAQIPAMIDDLITFANEDDEFIHPVVKAIILHFLIGYIHPFSDGNGRTARALFSWFCLKHHYDLLEYLPLSRHVVHAPAQYLRAYQLTGTDSNDMTYFIDFHIPVISRALEDLRQYLIRRNEEEAESLGLVEQIPALSFRQADILRAFIRHPTRPYTTSEIAGTYKVSLPTARTDLLFLWEMGKLKKYQDGKRQVFVVKNDFSST